MIIIGELINASRKAIGSSIEAQDAAAIQKVAEDQHAARANYIDVNAGIFVKKEPEYLKWLVQTVQQVDQERQREARPHDGAAEERRRDSARRRALFAHLDRKLHQRED